MAISETITLVDLVSQPSKQAADAVSALDAKVIQAKASLAAMDPAGVKAIAKSLADAERAAGKAGNALAAGGKGAKAAASEGKGGLDALGAAAAAAGGAAATGFATMAAAALATGAAIATVTAGVVTLLERAQEIQNVKGMETARLGMLGFGKELQEIAATVSTNVPQSRQEIVQWADDLQKLGVTDLSVLQFKLQSLAATEATMGKEGVSTYLSLQDKVQALAFAQKRAAEMGVPFWQGLQMGDSEIRGLRKMGVTLEEVAKQMRVPVAQLAWQLRAGRADAAGFAGAVDAITARKGDPEINRRMATMPSMIGKVKDQLDRFLEGIDLQPLLKPFQMLADVFNEQTESGQALKFLIQQIGNGGAKAGGDIMSGLVWAMKEALIVGLELYIQLAPPLSKLWSMLKDMAGSASDVYERVNRLTGGGKEGGGNPIMNALKGAASGALGGPVNMAMGAMGGVVGGITGGWVASSGDRKDAMTGAARDESQATIDAYKEEFGIRSPSTVMIGIGEQLGAGLRIGVGRSSDGVGSAVAGMAGDVAGAAGTPAGMGPAPSSSGPSIVVEAGAIVVHGGGQSAGDIAETVLTRLFERIAITQGVA